MGRSNATLSGRLLSGSKPILPRALALGVAAGALLLGVRGTQDAVANGDTRTITIKHMHTKEETTVTFRRDGRYVSEALEKLNWALRDWRTDEPIRMDPRLFDVAWEVQRMVGSEQPFHVVSAYRSPGTNSMLRRRSRAVAKHSQHTLGKAMDFYLPDTPTARIREAGMRLQRGGVGFYPGAHTPFIHLDAGSVRSWPRMTRDQLVRLFPDEKTVHLPADGQPLGGYELARAEIMSGGGAVAGYAAADLDEGAVLSSGRKSLWAALFGGDEEEADARPTRGRRAAPKPQPTVMAYANNTAYPDNNSPDGGRFPIAMAPAAPPARSLAQERAERLAPRAAEAPAAQAVAPVNAAAPAQDSRPALVDAPIPLARPRGLTVPEQPAQDGAAVQVAALAGSGGALAFAPPSGPGADQRLVLAALPPRRPGEVAPLAQTIVAGKPMEAPLPPTRPALTSFALAGQAVPLAPTELRGSDAAAQAAIPEGRLVAVSHPLPPSRPQAGGVTVAASTQARRAPTPIEQQYDADRSGLDSLFAAVTRPPAPAGRSVTVATARARTTAPASAPITGPSPAAALGFSHAEPNDAKTGSFSGPAVRALPTNFVQN
ncbi:hypothetical protein ASE63_03710 [Bosea sp. Root381]|uniref:DUF882 domain-containing protein n=1 Tax=Bosea sp. Root381 TaxID=1736524 RepID=UPI0006F74188|nr:DUF882 domain-containing protein [Bosea sp. Root381]KRE09652.1 hypothetical protein ASE63_03710 [Bosea sp. Root381]